jgi:hypothetical protein
MDTADLLNFLQRAHHRGYAAGRDAPTVREPDRSTTIACEFGAWRLHDNYFGGEPYGGRAVAFLDDKPVWMAVYYGRVATHDAEVQAVYAFLQRAIRPAPADLPFRGPERYTEEAFAYRHARRGDVQDFSGEETIAQSGRPVYLARCTGGLVDQRVGD